jgi:hypothetical protein
MDFTTEELELLREIVRHQLGQVAVEVFHTDTHDFKELLKHRQVVLEGMLHKLERVPVTAAA